MFTRKQSHTVMHTTQKGQEQAPSSIAVPYNRTSNSSSASNNTSNAAMTSSFQRHPLLAASSSMSLSSSLSSSSSSLSGQTQHTRKHASLSTSNSAHKQHSPNCSSSTLSATSQRGTSDARLSPLDAAAARRASITAHADEEQDADDVEADLRFPSFARRPSQPMRARRPSPLRNTAFDVPSGMASVSALDLADSGDEEEEEDEKQHRAHIDDDADVDSARRAEDSYDVFHLDEGNTLHQTIWRDGKGNDDGEGEGDDDDEASYGDLASPLFSVAPSFASHTSRRTSDHSSAADLDMIWDDEDEDHHAVDKRRTVRRTPPSGSTPAVSERRTSLVQKRTPSSAPAEHREVHGDTQDLIPATVLPFARKSGEKHSISSLRQPIISTPSSAMLCGPTRRASNMSIGTIASTAVTTTSPSSADLRRHSATSSLYWQNAKGRERSGTDPLRRSHAPYLRSANDGIDARHTRSASASPPRRDRLEDQFAELLEAIRI